MAPQEIIWHSPEFRYQHKDIAWYWMSIIAAGILFLVALWQRNLLFAIFIVIAEAMVLFWAKEYPKNLRFKIDRKGIHIDTLKFLSYGELEGFTIIENHEESDLILKTKFRLHPYMKVVIFEEDAHMIREFLRNYLDEVEYEESLSDGISKLLGF